MFKYIMAALIYMYAATVRGDTTIVSPSIAELYGSALRGDVVIVHRGARYADIEYVINKYTTDENVIMMGRRYGLTIPHKYVPILTQVDESVFLSPSTIFDLPVYTISSDGQYEVTRHAEFFPTSENIVVKNERELRLAIVELRQRPFGFLFVNVLTLRNNWGRVISYREVENIFVSANRKHMEIGICYRGFRTAYALGPTLDELPAMIAGKYSTHVCASVPRLVQLGALDHYMKHSGKFYFVQPTKPR